MKRREIVTLAAVLAAAALLITALALVLHGPSGHGNAEQGPVGETGTESESLQTTTKEEMNTEDETESHSENGEDPNGKDDGAAGTDGHGIHVTKPPIGSPDKLTDPNTITAPSTPVEPQSVTFPYTDAESGLVILSVSPYSGIFLENGEDTEIENVGAVIARNTGSRDIELARITLQGNSETYEYEGSAIPAGGQIVIQEKNRKAYTEQEYQSCLIETAQTELDLAADRISCTENENGSLRVTNRSASAIPCVRIFYKFYMEEEDAYLGGITYTAKITDLAAGQSISVTPSHYSAGYSRVVMIRTYDEE